MMDKISDVTWQDIIDVIRNGFVVSFDEQQYDSISGNYIVSYRAKISYHGRLDERGFLERLYDLDNMPSNDSRYSNAHGDISCHLRFDDYEDEYWIFQDERFSLRQGDGDEALLHFLCIRGGETIFRSLMNYFVKMATNSTLQRKYRVAIYMLIAPAFATPPASKCRPYRCRL